MFMTRMMTGIRAWRGWTRVRIWVACGLFLGGNVMMHAGDKDPWRRHPVDDTSRGADGVRLADVNGDGFPDITTGWEEGGLTRLYLHPGIGRVREPWPAVTVGSTPAVEDAVFVDVDNDGVWEVLSACEGTTRSLFLHRLQPGFARLDPTGWRQSVIPASLDRMAWMFCLALDLDSDGVMELVAGGKGSGAAIGYFFLPPGRSAVEGYRWREIFPAGWIMSILAADMDGDGDPDVVVSDRRGVARGARWHENPGPDRISTAIWRTHWIGGRGREVMFMRLGDVDGDGLEDAVIATKPDGIILCRRLDRTGTQWHEETIAYPPNMGTAKAVAIGKINRDDRPDLVITCEAAEPPKSGLRWLERRDQGWTDHEVAGPEGIKFDRLELPDLDCDGDLDILTCEERSEGRGLGVIWYENPLQSNAAGLR